MKGEARDKRGNREISNRVLQNRGDLGQAFPRRFLGFTAVVAAQRVIGRTKNRTRRFPFHVGSSLVPLRF